MRDRPSLELNIKPDLDRDSSSRGVGCEHTGPETLRKAATSPSFAELFTPKLVTVLREGYGLAHLRADALAGLTVAIVALPLSMAIAIALGRVAGAGPVHGDRRRLPGFGARRQPLPDRRARRARSSCSSPRRCKRTASTGCCSRRCWPALMLAAIGFLRLGTYIKFIPYPGDGRVHGRHRRHHSREPAQGSARPARSPATEPGALLDKLPVLWAACRRSSRRRSRCRSRRSPSSSALQDAGGRSGPAC